MEKTIFEGGEEFVVKSKISNLGKITAENSIVIVDLDGKQEPPVVLKEIKIGSSEVITSRLKAPPTTGSHRIGVVVKPDSKQEKLESRERKPNNSKSLNFEVKKTPAQFIDLELTDAGIEHTTIQDGEEIVVSPKVRNLGNIAVTQATVDIFIDGQLKGTHSVLNIAPNSSGSFKEPRRFKITGVGAHKISIKTKLYWRQEDLEPDKLKNNNSKEVEIKVKPVIK